MARQPYCFFGDIFRYAADFEDNTPRLHDRNPVINSAFTATHSGFSRFGCDRLIREDTDPYFATTLHKAGKRDTRRFYLTSLHPAWLKRLQAILPKGECIASLGSPFHTTAMLFTVL